jgi:general secretion pathway protein K
VAHRGGNPVKRIAGRNNESGMILLIVLWSVALMSVSVIALSAFAQKSASATGVDADVLRTRMALESGIAIGAAEILAAAPEDRVFFSGEAIASDVGGGRMVEVAVTDAAGFVDLNRADAKLIAAIAAAALPADRATAFVNGVTILRKARRKADAPDQAAAPEFVATAEIFGMPGLGPAAARRLAPLFAFAGADGKVNPMAAPDVVLRAIPGISAAEVKSLLTARRARAWSGQAVANVLARHPEHLAIVPGRVFVVAVKSVSGPGMLAGSRLTATIAIIDAEGAPYQVVAWSW